MKQTSDKAIYDIQLIFNWIVEYKTAHDGNSPSLRELMRACNLTSSSVASYVLRRLERAGKISLTGQRSRTRSIVVIGGEWRLINPNTA